MSRWLKLYKNGKSGGNRDIFFELPEDIGRTITQIAADIDFATAHSLCKTSSHLRTWSLPALYRAVQLRDDLSYKTFFALLEQYPVLGEHVRYLVYTIEQPHCDHSCINSGMLTYLPNLVSLSWQGWWTWCNPTLPLAGLPISLKHLSFFSYGSGNIRSWEGLELAPNLETLDIGISWDFEGLLLQNVPLGHYTQLRHIGLRTLIGPGMWTAEHFIQNIIVDLLPKFPETLRVCVLYWETWEEQDLAPEMRELILGNVDDRIVLSTSDRHHVRPRGPYTDFLLRTGNSSILGDNLPLCEGVHGFWKKAETMVERRRLLRQGWGDTFPSREVIYRMKRPIKKKVSDSWNTTAAVAVWLPCILLEHGWKAVCRR